MRKYLFLFITIFSLSLFAFASGESGRIQSQDAHSEISLAPQPKTYIAAIVKRGENWKVDSLVAMELQEKHLGFLRILKQQNKLIASGPLTTSSEARGLYIFNVKTIEAAETLAMQDEAVQSGWLAMDFHVWKSRDYDFKTQSTNVDESSLESSKERKKGFGKSTIVTLLTIFVLLICVLAYRTFRMKSSV